jgi:hypothetical protein
LSLGTNSAVIDKLANFLTRLTDFKGKIDGVIGRNRSITRDIKRNDLKQRVFPIGKANPPHPEFDHLIQTIGNLLGGAVVPRIGAVG